MGLTLPFVICQQEWRDNPDGVSDESVARKRRLEDTENSSSDVIDTEGQDKEKTEPESKKASTESRVLKKSENRLSSFAFSRS